MSFSENLASFFGRVELLAFGAEDDRREASNALLRGDFLAARLHAKSLLAKRPDSKIGLALLADAAEGAGLAEEAVLALSPLCEAMPWRADPWLRLAQAKRDAGFPEEEVREALERAARATEGERRQALLWLCDLDLQSKDPARASRWLVRLGAFEGDPEVALRVAEHALSTGDLAKAREAALHLGEMAASDGRRALVLGRLRAREGDLRAFDGLLRAFMLEAPGAASELARYVAECRDAVLVSRARRVVEGAGHLDEPRWAAAFARAEGRAEDARRALRKAAREGDPEALKALFDGALSARDRGALEDAMQALESTQGVEPPFARSLSEALSAEARGDHATALSHLDAIPEGPAASFCDEIRASLMRSWLPETGEANWPALLSELQRAAKRLDRFELLSAIEAIAVERERPLRLAILGEFNAGKSTFLNALLGADVVPTGILPTTASLHWLAWAADPFARIVVRGAPDRIVAHAELKRALRELADANATVERVFLHAPAELLRRIELLDTPGLNSLDVSHTEAARKAFDEAHLAIWLLDSTQPLKESERAILAEIARMGLPIWVLSNKGDRLGPEEAQRALEHVREGLEGAGLVSHAEPLIVSAKRALLGRLGDEEALATSGWEEVERVLDGIVKNHLPLRERALRRRALSVTRTLSEAARTLAEAEERERLLQAALDERLLRAASLVERGDRDPLVAALREPLSLLAADLLPLAERPGDEPWPLSEGAREYAKDRAIFRLTEPLLRGCLAKARLDDADPALRSDLAIRFQALLTGAMAMAADGSVVPDPERLAAAALQILESALRDAVARPRAEKPASALALRLSALELACCRDRDRAA